MMPMKKLLFLLLSTEWTRPAVAFEARKSVNSTSDNISSLIIGGDPAAPGDYPYYTALYTESGQFVCGGAVIAPDLVLTSGDCMDAVPISYAVVGAYKFGSSGGQNRTCVQTPTHPEYNSSNFGYNVGLCVLDQPVEVDTTAVYLELNNNSSVPANEEMVTLMGLGSNDTGIGSFPDVLQFTTLPVISNERCNNIINNITNSSSVDLVLEDNFCTWDETLETGGCFGDIGSPLVTVSPQNDGRILHTLVGVLNGGVSCIDPQTPNINARISLSIDWVEDIACNDLGSTTGFCTPEPSSAPSLTPTILPAKTSKKGKNTGKGTKKVTKKVTKKSTTKTSKAPAKTSKGSKKIGKGMKNEKKSKSSSISAAITSETTNDNSETATDTSEIASDSSNSATGTSEIANGSSEIASDTSEIANDSLEIATDTLDTSQRNDT